MVVEVTSSMDNSSKNGRIGPVPRQNFMPSLEVTPPEIPNENRSNQENIEVLTDSGNENRLDLIDDEYVDDGIEIESINDEDEDSVDENNNKRNRIQTRSSDRVTRSGDKYGLNLVCNVVENEMIGMDEIEPINFEDTWNCRDREHRLKWRMAINKELTDMKDRDVWTVVDNVGQREIPLKWVFK